MTLASLTPYVIKKKLVLMDPVSVDNFAKTLRDKWPYFGIYPVKSSKPFELYYILLKKKTNRPRRNDRLPRDDFKIISKIHVNLNILKEVFYILKEHRGFLYFSQSSLHHDFFYRNEKWHSRHYVCCSTCCLKFLISVSLEFGLWWASFSTSCLWPCPHCSGMMRGTM